MQQGHWNLCQMTTIPVLERRSIGRTLPKRSTISTFNKAWRKVANLPEVYFVKVICGYTNRSGNSTWSKAGMKTLGVVPQEVVLTMEVLRVHWQPVSRRRWTNLLQHLMRQQWTPWLRTCICDVEGAYHSLLEYVILVRSCLSNGELILCGLWFFAARVQSARGVCVKGYFEVKRRGTLMGWKGLEWSEYWLGREHDRVYEIVLGHRCLITLS